MGPPERVKAKNTIQKKPLLRKKISEPYLLENWVETDSDQLSIDGV